MLYDHPVLATRALILLLLAMLLRGAPAGAVEAPPLVVVELFTSQGCSSCPPADAYLGELARRPDVLALAFHVDYWNYIGWNDPFASKLATQRQRDYSRQLNLRYVYTPQMVIDGVSEGVGSDRGSIGPLIKAAAEAKARRVPVSVARGRDGKLDVHVDAGGGEPATVLLIRFDREHSTQVLRGENEGQTLREYQVVRSCAPIGIWRGEALDIAVPADQAAGDSGVAIVVQQGAGAGRIIGATVLRPTTS